MIVVSDNGYFGITLFLLHILTRIPLLGACRRNTQIEEVDEKKVFGAGRIRRPASQLSILRQIWSSRFSHFLYSGRLPVRQKASSVTIGQVSHGVVLVLIVFATAILPERPAMVGNSDLVPRNIVVSPNPVALGTSFSVHRILANIGSEGSGWRWSGREPTGF